VVVVVPLLLARSTGVVTTLVVGRLTAATTLVTSLVATLVSPLVAGHGSSGVGALSLSGDNTVLLLDGVHEQSQEVGDLVSGLVVEVGEVLSLVALPVLLILVGLVDEVTLLLHLVMVDVKGSTVDVQISVLDLGGGIRGLEANESEGRLVILLGEELKGLNLTVVLEQVSEVLLGGFSGKVLHVEIASLLGVLVLKGLVGEFLLALTLLKSGYAVKELTIVIVLVMHGLDGLGSGTGSVLTVSSVSATEADESEFALVDGFGVVDFFFRANVEG
jgi:hypothetical protein